MLSPQQVQEKGRYFFAREARKEASFACYAAEDTGQSLKNIKTTSSWEPQACGNLKNQGG